MLAAAFLLPTATAVGLGIGEQTAVSNLFEPLRVEIPVELGGLSPDAVNVSLRMGDVGTAGAGEGLRREIVTGRDGRHYLRVSSQSVIREPALVLNVDLASGAIRVRRELTLLFDPAITSPAASPTLLAAAPRSGTPASPATASAGVAPQDADEAALTALIDEARRASAPAKAARRTQLAAAPQTAAPVASRHRPATVARPGLRMSTHLSLAQTAQTAQMAQTASTASKAPASAALPLPVAAAPARLKVAASLSTRSLERLANALIQPATAADLPAAKPADASAATSLSAAAAAGGTVQAVPAVAVPAVAAAEVPAAAVAVATPSSPAGATELAAIEAETPARAAAPAVVAPIAAVAAPTAEPETPYGVLVGVLAAAAIAFGGLLKALSPAPVLPRRRREGRATSQDAMALLEAAPLSAPVAVADAMPARVTASRPLELDGSAPLEPAERRTSAREVRPLDFVVPEPSVAPVAPTKAAAKVTPDWSPEDFDLLEPLDHDQDRRG